TQPLSSLTWATWSRLARFCRWRHLRRLCAICRRVEGVLRGRPLATRLLRYSAPDGRFLDGAGWVRAQSGCTLDSGMLASSEGQCVKENRAGTDCRVPRIISKRNAPAKRQGGASL